MFPSIKTRFHTENVYQNIIKKEKQSFFNPRMFKRNSINASLSYLDEIKFSKSKVSRSLQISPQKNKRIKTDNVTIEKSTQSTMVPQEISQQSKLSKRPRQQKQKQPLRAKRGRETKIQHILKFFQKQKCTIEENYAKSKSKQRQLHKYDFVEQQFQKLPKKKTKWSPNCLNGFLQILSESNPFFRKINELVALCLLKIGHIQTYQEAQIVQRQEDPMNYIGIILWGQILLRCRDSKLKMYLFPGDTINQQILLYNDRFSFDKKYLKKGCQSIKQSGKTKTKTGILFLKVDQYKEIFQELVKIGQKNNVLIVENMMKWSYSKKKNIRKQFSRI